MKKNILIILPLVILLYFATELALKSESFLSVLGRVYFDEDYYLNHYPEVKKSRMSAYNHYMSEGWKLGYNPNEKFNTNFYKNFYYHKNKYKLSPLSLYVRRHILMNNNYYNKSDILKTTTLKNPKYYLSLVAIFQNEARFLKEWIEFYRMMGVEHFYLYNHRSEDDYMAILKPYIDQGIVELKQIYEKPADTKQFVRLQTLSYNKTIQQNSELTEWLIIVDTDEFIYPKNYKTLKESLKLYDDCAAVSVPWRMFGTNGIEKLGQDDLIIDKLVTASDQIGPDVKTIVKPRYVMSYNNPHYPELKNGYAQCDYEHDYFYGPYYFKNTSDVWRVNHYWTRDNDFFENNKLSRLHVKDFDGKRNILVNLLHLYKLSPNIYKKINDSMSRLSKDEIEQMTQQKIVNQKKYEETQLRKVKDLSIQRFVPEMKKRMKIKDASIIKE